MSRQRCPSCFQVIRSAFHDLECPALRPPPAPKQAKTTSRAGYVAPSRRGKVPRAEYDAARRVTAEHKRQVTNARAARYRQRRAERKAQDA